ncbi:MAG: SH3 domain-containing protein [Planctomycetota bacterium]|nr:SH3 domain-containing protein [Planctomycetota bacterium]
MKSTQEQGRQGLLGVVATLIVGLLLTGARAQNKVEKGKAKSVEASTGQSAKKTAEKNVEKNTAKDAVPVKAPAAKVPATAVVENPADQGPRLARIESDSVQVRCFASVNSPVYEGVLPKGTAVMVGTAVGEFCPVQLPIGVIGYVSKKFTSTPEAGLVRTTGVGVSFRYRPTPRGRAEQPVARMAKGTALKYLGEKGAWWRVRMATESAYLPIKDIQVFQTANATLQKSQAELARQHQAQWQGAVSAYEQALAAAVLEKARTARLAELRQAYVTELEKVVDQQQFDSLMGDVSKLLTELPEDTPLWAAAQGLKRAVKTQQVMLQAKALLASTPPTAKAPDIKVIKTPADPLAHLQHIGWLSRHPRVASAGLFQLTKGGKLVCNLKCSSLRYDLSMFAGVEIGVIGSTERDEQMSYVDVGEIVVLGRSR